MIIVTAGGRLISRSIVEGLDRCGEEDILAENDLADKAKLGNIAGRRIVDYLDRGDSLGRVRGNSLRRAKRSSTRAHVRPRQSGTDVS